VKKLLVMNGPNMEILHRRDPSLYGGLSLQDLEARLNRRASEAGLQLDFFQSNHEGALVDRLNSLGDDFQGVILNPAGLTHTSVALRDSVEALQVPVLEVHLSNIDGREDFRRVSLISPVARGRISGLGPEVYLLALEWFIQTTEQTQEKGP
jgi:3-dehydroquinate dehydratase-2